MVEFLTKIKAFKKVALVLAGGMIGSMVGSKIIKTIIDWTEETVKKED